MYSLIEILCYQHNILIKITHIQILQMNQKKLFFFVCDTAKFYTSLLTDYLKRLVKLHLLDKNTITLFLHNFN